MYPSEHQLHGRCMSLSSQVLLKINRMISSRFSREEGKIQPRLNQPQLLVVSNFVAEGSFKEHPRLARNANLQPL